MDPMLSWVVCLLSAFLLTVGGYLLARAAASRRMVRSVEELAKLKATLDQYLGERQALESRERTLRNQLDAAERALMARRELESGPPAPGETEAYFGGESVPHMQQLSEDEFEIPDAAPRSMKEAVRDSDSADELDGHDETRQFNLHSPENVVQFMQRIDELTEENAELKTNMAEHEQSLKEKRAEGNEQLHRFAALDATAQKLRAELKRRNERIKFLEEQLKEQLANDDGPLTNPNEPERSPSGNLPPSMPTPPGGLPMKTPPPPPPPAAFGMQIEPVTTVAGPHDGPTLPVSRVAPEDLEREDE